MLKVTQTNIEELRVLVARAAWFNKDTMRTKSAYICREDAAGGYIASIQIISSVSDQAIGRLACRAAFFKSMNNIRGRGAPFAVDREDCIELHIYNFFPLMISKIAYALKLGKLVRVFVEVNNDKLNDFCSAVSGRYDRSWGYEMKQKRGIPRIFRSGPGLFGYSIQLFFVDTKNREVELVFFARPRPNFLLKMGFFSVGLTFLKRIELRKGLFWREAKLLRTAAEVQMLKIHNRVHREFVRDISKA